MIRPRFNVYSALLACSLAALPASAETLNSLAEFGNAASANATSGADIPRGADFTNAATGTYTITAGGTDIWGGSDNGSFIYDDSTTRAAGENFSAIVRSVSIAGDPAEALAGEWGRTGPMARKTPDVANSANAANIRKSGSANGFTVIQGRPNDGAGTDRGPGNNGEFGNTGANTANGSVRNTPIWLALHRVNGEWYGTWADDVAGSPGTWSTPIQRVGTADMAGEVYVGLAHQSHNINPVINTALFEQFEVGPFTGDGGDFAQIGTGDVVLNGTEVQLTASASALGAGTPQEADWQVRYLSSGTATVPGTLQADIYVATPNGGNIAAFDAIKAAGSPSGTANIETILWAGGAYTTTNAAGVNLFAEAVPGSFGGNEDNYAVDMTGEIFIPSDTSRDGLEAVLFHDGVDDFTYLEIDGVPLMENNQWTNTAGTANNGGTQATLDVSDAKYDDGEWVPFRMVTWEGGGGDDANLVWDALDRTGLDADTGAVDATQGSYTGGPLGDGAQINFPNDASDQIPSANFRRIVPAAAFTQTGFGTPDMLVLNEPLTPGVVAIEISVNGSVVNTIPVLPVATGGDFISHNVVNLTLADAGTGGTADVDPATIMMSIDGAMVTPDSVMKDGTITTIVYTFPAAPEPLTGYNFVIMGNTTAAGSGVQPFEVATTLNSFPINEELRAGLPTPPNATEGWHMMEFDVIATIGGGLGGGEQMFRDAQTVIRDAVDPLAEGTEPFVNHYDPDSNAGGGGDWRPDIPILSDDVGVGDDQYCTLARTIITIAPGDEGEYTFRIRGDDGYGLRIANGVFTSIAGNGNNSLDSRDRSVAYFPIGTGDSNAWAVCNIPVGDHLVEFFGFEGGGGSYQEISWAKGSFNNLNQTNDFALLGDSSAFTGGESVWGTLPETVLPPLPGDGESGWSTYIWYDAPGGSLNETMNWIRAADPAAAVATLLPELNHSDDGGNAGRFNPTAAFPGDPNPGAGTDNIKMLARAIIVAPVDGDYTIQVRSDDGFLFRFVDPTNAFHSKNGPGVLHGSAPYEVYFPNGTGDSNTRAAVFLTAGAHEVYYTWWEGGGGAHFEISSAPGVELNQNGPYELLSDTPTATNLYVGKPPAAEFRITDIIYDPVADQFTLTWLSEEGASYALLYDTDLDEFGIEVDDAIMSGGATTTFGPFDNPVPGTPRIYFRAERN